MTKKQEILQSKIGVLPMVDLSDRLPLFYEAMDEYAKQQAIAFFKYAVENEIVRAGDTPVDFCEDCLDDDYDKFSQQQTTNTDTKTQ